MEQDKLDILMDKATSLCDDIRYMESLDVDAACRRGLAEVCRRRRLQTLQRLTKIAACLSIPLAAAVILLAISLFSPKDEGLYASVTASPGSVVRYELPDNSVVWLNSGTTLKYPASFCKKHRNVELEGEAYFDVTTDPAHPFYVRTGDGLSIRVCGTEFDVSAYSDDDTIETTLESGHVIVEHGERTINLEPGEQATYDRNTGKMIKRKVNPYDNSAWKDGKMIFRNATLADMFKSLSRTYGVEFDVRGEIGADDRYRATFRNESLSRILDFLSRTADFTWEFDDAGKVVTVCIDKKK